MRRQEQRGKLSSLVVSVLGTDVEPLNFTPTVAITSESPQQLTGNNGLVLANSDLSMKIERLPNQPIRAVLKHGPIVMALEGTRLQISTTYGNVFTPYSFGLTDAYGLIFTGTQIIIGDVGFLRRIDINTLTVIDTVAVPHDYHFIRHVDGRMFVAARGANIVRFSDDWGTNFTDATLVGGSASNITNVRVSQYTTGRSYVWNGVAQFSTNSDQPAVTYTAYSAFPATTSTFVDFLEIASGELLAVVANDGIYRNTDPTNAASAWTQVQAATTLLGQISELTDRIVVNGDGGIYTNLDKTGLTWTFTNLPELGAQNGGIDADDLTYITDEVTGDLLYDEITDQFITEEVPTPLALGGMVYWFNSKLQPVTNTDGRIMTVATDNSSYDAASTLENTIAFWRATAFDPNVIAFDGKVSSGVNLSNPSQLNNIWAGGATAVAVIDLFDNKTEEALYQKVQWALTIDNPTSGVSSIRLQHSSAGTNYSFTTDTQAFVHGQPNVVIWTWDKDTPNTDPLIYLNGVSLSVTKDAGGGATDDDSGSDLRVGRNATGDKPFNGEWFEGVLYRRALSGPEVTELSDFLINEWAIGSGRESPAIPYTAQDVRIWFDPSYTELLSPSTVGDFSSLLDKSAKNNALGVNAGVPQVVLNSLNGRPVIEDNGGSLSVNTSAGVNNLWSGGGASLVYAGRIDNIAGSWGTLVDKSSWTLRARVSGNQIYFNFIHDTTGTNWEYETTSAPINTGEDFHLIMMWNSGLPVTPPTLYVNGLVVSMPVLVVGSGTLVLESSEMRFLNNNIGTEQQDGQLYEFFYSNNFYLPTVEIDAVNSYLSQRWIQ